MSRLYRVLYPLAAIALIAIVIISCEKKAPKCRRDCFTTIISGRIYDKTSGAPFANVPVKVRWIKGGCLGCTRYVVASGNSAQDGSFLFTVILDTSAFEKYRLNVSIPNDSNYFNNFLFFTGPELSYDIPTPDPARMQNILFEFYQKTSLTVRLHRVQNDSWDYFWYGQSYMRQGGASYWAVNGQQNAKDTTLSISTAAGIYTKVYWEKRNFASGPISSFKDSIICTTAGPNIVDINY